MNEYMTEQELSRIINKNQQIKKFSKISLSSSALLGSSTVLAAFFTSLNNQNGASKILFLATMFFAATGFVSYSTIEKKAKENKRYEKLLTVLLASNLKDNDEKHLKENSKSNLSNDDKNNTATNHDEYVDDELNM